MTLNQIEKFLEHDKLEGDTVLDELGWISSFRYYN